MMHHRKGKIFLQVEIDLLFQRRRLELQWFLFNGLKRLLQALLEDSGYIPRLAVLSDRLLRRLGVNGQGLIPLILGFSCITVAIITTRMMPTRRERPV